jgi:hypothetical protein
MTVNLQGIILTLLIAFLLGILLGYYLVQGRLQRQTNALKESQRRLAELEQSYELRLRETTDTLRREYEAELAETIEHYQDQLSQKTLDLEQTYATRFQVLQQGDLAAASSVTPGRPPVEPLAAASPQREAAARGRIEPVEDDSPSLTPPEVLQLKRQYEMRLKEAAQKLQSAYERQLSQHARNVRADLQAEYEKRLKAKVAEQEQALAERQAELEAEYAARQEALNTPQAEELTVSLEVPTPSQIMGTGDDTTITLSPLPPQGLVQPLPTPDILEASINSRIEEATEQIRQDYEQRLSAKLEEMNARVEELEDSYQQQIQALKQQSAAAEPAKPGNDDVDDFFGPLDLSDISQSS